MPKFHPGSPVPPGTYRSGAYSVTVNSDGGIQVKSGDWISKYADCLYGNPLKGWTDFGRERGGTLQPLANPNTIRAGETIFHLPTARRGGTPSYRPVPTGRLFQIRTLGSGQIGKIVNLEKLRKVLKAKRYKKWLRGKPGLVIDVLFLEVRDKTNYLSAYFAYLGGGAGLSWPVVSASHVGPWNHFRTSQSIPVIEFDGVARFTTGGAASWTHNILHLLGTPDGVDGVYLDGFKTGFTSGGAISTSVGYLLHVGEMTSRTPSSHVTHPPVSKSQLLFNGRHLSWLNNEGRVAFSVPAVSGLKRNNRFLTKLIESGRTDLRPGVDYTDAKYQDISYAGPIPQGSYFLSLQKGMPYEKQGGGWGTGGWSLQSTSGIMRNLSILDAWLKQQRDIDLPGVRSGFFLHHDGGSDGTAGCIGITRSSDVTKLRKQLSSYYGDGHRRITVKVDY